MTPKSSPNARSPWFLAALLALLLAGTVAAAIIISSTQKENAIPIRENLDAYSWEEIRQISETISKSKSKGAALLVAKHYNLLGSDGKLTGNETKAITLPKYYHFNTKVIEFNSGDYSGKYEPIWSRESLDVRIQILDFWADTKEDGSKAGITFIFKDLVAQHQMNKTATNAGGWEKCEMRTWMNTTFFDTLPNELSSLIVPVVKRTNNLGELTEETARTAISTTSDKLWLPAMTEVYDDSWPAWVKRWEGEPYEADVYVAEGTQYKLYSDNNVSVPVDGSEEEGDPVLGKTFNGAMSGWYLRSPNTNLITKLNTSFMRISSDAKWYKFSADTPSGVAPAFCI